MITVKCANCGKEIETYPSRVKRYEERNCNFYCSKECKDEYWNKHRTGENNPKSKPKITVCCAWCGKEFQLPSWRIKKSERHFCNAQCRSQWLGEHRKGPSNPYYKKESHVILNCAYCGKEFTTTISQYKRYKFNYCSKKCADNAKIGVSQGPKAELHKCTCPICGKEFYQSKNAKNQKKTCSKECGAKLMGQTRNNCVTLICQYCGEEYTVHKCEENRSKYCSRSCLALAKLVSSDGKSNTRPERIVADVLDGLNIKFKQQYPVDKMKVDFYLPDSNTILEVYGDYWHANPLLYPKEKLDQIQRENVRRDAKRRYVLTKKFGYNFSHVWEHDILENAEKALKQVLEI